jgi:hypothetical protein
LRSVWQLDWNILEGIIAPFFTQNISSLCTPVSSTNKLTATI